MSVSGVCDHRCVHVFIDPDGHNVDPDGRCSP
jgi:hypothetical protein